MKTTNLKLAEWIEANFELFKMMSRAGIMPTKVLNGYKMYQYWNSLTNKEKMLRHEFTAEHFRVSESTVRSTIKFMNQPTPIEKAST